MLLLLVGALLLLLVVVVVVAAAETEALEAAAEGGVITGEIDTDGWVLLRATTLRGTLTIKAKQTLEKTSHKIVKLNADMKTYVS